MLKILLVDDNRMNRDMMSHWFIRWGYEVTMAVDGEEAVSKGHSDKPDLILMDLGLPKIDGLETTRLLKADINTRHIPVIAVTGYSIDCQHDNALVAGCDEYCTKPVDFNRLHVKIEALLQRTPPPNR